ncbi:hypothetical protein [Aerococcus urinae]
MTDSHNNDIENEDKVFSKDWWLRLVKGAFVGIGGSYRVYPAEFWPLFLVFMINY